MFAWVYQCSAGGSIETILDECTAEIAKCEFGPYRYDDNFESQPEKAVSSSSNLSHLVQNQIHIEEQTPNCDCRRNL